MNKVNQANRERQRRKLVEYKYQTEWKIYDAGGNELENRRKLFAKQKSAEDFAQKLKDATPPKNNIRVVVRKLESNEIIRRYKKLPGRKNYRRG